MSDTKIQKTMQMGLGEAVLRLLHLETLRSRGISAEAKKERDLIIDALNTHQLDLGFDCNEDGIPDSIQIFAKSAQTACCRLMPLDTSRKTKSSSRRGR